MTLGNSCDQMKVKLEEQELEQVSDRVCVLQSNHRRWEEYSRCKTTYWIGITNEWEVWENLEVTQSQVTLCVYILVLFSIVSAFLCEINVIPVIIIIIIFPQKSPVI